jgi:hypothetical protein
VDPASLIPSPIGFVRRRRYEKCGAVWRRVAPRSASDTLPPLQARAALEEHPRGARRPAAVASFCTIVRSRMWRRVAPCCAMWRGAARALALPGIEDANCVIHRAEPMLGRMRRLGGDARPHPTCLNIWTPVTSRGLREPLSLRDAESPFDRSDSITPCEASREILRLRRAFTRDRIPGDSSKHVIPSAARDPGVVRRGSTPRSLASLGMTRFQRIDTLSARRQVFVLRTETFPRRHRCTRRVYTHHSMNSIPIPAITR